jgi:tetratricopeptide (TPR) repeat protein
MNRASFAIFSLFVSCVAACGRRDARVGARPDSSASALSASPEPPRSTVGNIASAEASAPVASPLPSPVPIAQPVPLNEDRVARRKVYLAALQRGRGATTARRYGDAVKAFDEAIEIDGGSARAHAERGYAHLLAKRYEEALHDFEAASELPSDVELAGQVWFNRGLTELALGRSEEAGVAFYRSNRLVPSKAAQDKLAGKKVCAVTVDRARASARPYDGWLAWWTAIDFEVEHDQAQELKRGLGYSEGDQGPYPPKNEAEARAVYCRQCEGDGPWSVDFGGLEFDIHVLARQGGKLWDFGVVGSGLHSMPSSWPCGGGDEVVFGAAGKYAFARALSAPWMKSPVLIQDGKDTVKACPDDVDSLRKGEMCGDFCASSTATETYFVFDIERHQRILTVKQQNQFQLAVKPPPFDVVLKAGAEGFELQGEECASVPYEAP